MIDPTASGFSRAGDDGVRVGERFGSYRLQECIGAGSFGQVYRAIDEVTGDEVAVKLLIAQRRVDFEDFRREARILSRLHHHALVPTYELSRDHGQWFFAMEYVRGSHITRSFPASSHPEPSGERLRPILSAIVDCLRYVHSRGVVHADLKPENVLLRDDDDRVAVIDFGLSRLLEQLPRPGMAGTPAYMAPELLWGSAATQRSDAYALGVLVYECLTGARPPDGFGLPAPLALPEPWKSAVSGLLQEDPDTRTTLDRFAEQLGLPPAGPSPLFPALSFVGRGRELDTLQTARARSMGGRPQAVFLEGESGIGKTACVREFIQTGGSTIEVRCRPEDRTPLVPLDELASQLAAEELGPAPGGRAALDRLFHDPETDLALDLSGAELLSAGLQFLREMILERASKNDGLTIVVDDAQWCSPESTEFFIDLLQPRSRARALVIFCVRTTADSPSRFLDRWRSLRRQGFAPHFEELHLAPLGVAEVTRLVAGRAQSQGHLPPALGNPLTLRAWLFSSARGLGSPEVGNMVPWENLDASAREILTILATSRRPLTLDELGGIVQGRPLRIQLIHLERAGLVEFSGRDYRIAHDSFRSDLRARVPESALREVHARLVQTFWAARDSSFRVHHLKAAGELERARAEALRLAEWEERRGSFARAAALYEFLVEADADGVAKETHLVARARCMIESGENAEAAQILESVLARGDSARTREIRTLLGTAWFNSGRPKDGLRVLEPVLSAAELPTGQAKLLQLIPEIWPLTRAVRGRQRQLERAESSSELAWMVGRSLVFIDPPTGMRLLFRAAHVAFGAGQRPHLYKVLGFLAANVFPQLPVLREAAPNYLDEALALGQELSDDRLVAHAMLWKANLRLYEGNWEKLRDECNQAVDKLRTVRDSAWEIQLADSLLCFALRHLGAYRSCSGLALEHIAEARRRGWLHFLVMFSQLEDFAALARGDTESVVLRAAWIRENWLPNEYTIQTFYANAACAYAELMEGRPEVAHRMLEKDAKDFNRIGAKLVATSRIDRLVLSARVVAAYRNTKASASIRQIANALAKESRPDARAHAKAFRASSLVMTEPAKALAELTGALQLFEHAAMGMEAAVAKWHIGRLADNQTLEREAAAALETEGVDHPERWCSVMLPMSATAER